jgi:hypothetical protein
LVRLKNLDGLIAGELHVLDAGRGRDAPIVIQTLVYLLNRRRSLSFVRLQRRSASKMLPGVLSLIFLFDNLEFCQDTVLHYLLLVVLNRKVHRPTVISRGFRLLFFGFLSNLFDEFRS